MFFLKNHLLSIVVMIYVCFILLQSIQRIISVQLISTESIKNKFNELELFKNESLKQINTFAS